MSNKTSISLICLALTSLAPASGSDHQKVMAENLTNIIQRQQRAAVRPSYGELAYQCFTWDDLDEFIRRKQTIQITKILKHSAEFIDVVLAIKTLPADQRQRVLKACRRPLRPTWAEMGRVDPSGAGTTDAGRVTEMKTANAVVDLVDELARLPVGDIQKLVKEH